LYSDQIPYGRQWLDDDDIQSVVQVLKSSWLTQGPVRKEFETQLAKVVGAPYIKAVSTGTAALHCALKAAGVKAGDEVIVPNLTFAADASAVLFCGGTPILVDVEPQYFTLDPEHLEKSINSRTKAVIVVDFGGHPAMLEPVSQICQQYGLTLIEDGCHSLGATWQGKPIGSLTRFTVFSFHPVKVITSGEGGAVACLDKKDADFIDRFSCHGMEKSQKLKDAKGDWYYQICNEGYNYRLSDLHAALGKSQLKKLSAFLARRRQIVERYNNAFANLAQVITPQQAQDCQSAWHIYPLRFLMEKIKLDKIQLYNRLRSLGILTQVHYIPLHKQPLFKKFKDKPFPVSDLFYKQSFSLPLFPAMTNQQVEHVVMAVKQVIREATG